MLKIYSPFRVACLPAAERGSRGKKKSYNSSLDLFSADLSVKSALLSKLRLGCCLTVAVLQGCAVLRCYCIQQPAVSTEDANRRQQMNVGCVSSACWRTSRVHTKHNCSGRDMESSSTCPAVRNRKLQLDCVVARAVCWYTTPYRHRYVWVSQWWCTSLHQVAEKPARPGGSERPTTTQQKRGCVSSCVRYTKRGGCKM